MRRWWVVRAGAGDRGFGAIGLRRNQLAVGRGWCQGLRLGLGLSLRDPLVGGARNRWTVSVGMPMLGLRGVVVG